jgi:hypothetical protein
LLPAAAYVALVRAARSRELLSRRTFSRATPAAPKLWQTTRAGMQQQVPKMRLGANDAIASRPG